MEARGVSEITERNFRERFGVQISGYFGFKPINRGIGLPLRVDRDTKHNESRLKKKKKSGCSMNERGLYTEKLLEREIREARDKKRCRKKRDIVNLDLASEKRAQSPNFNKRASWRERYTVSKLVVEVEVHSIINQYRDA